MALNYKDLISDTLLELNKDKSLRKIKITDIQKKSGISRQTFYNYFIDIYDLIQYTYTKNIVVHWNPNEKNLDFCSNLLEDLSKTMKYCKFLKDSFEIHGPNNLTNYMVDYCIDFELKWMQTYYGNDPMPVYMKNAVVFAAGGSMYIKLQWIRKNINRPLFDVVKDIIDNENRCLTPLFFKNPQDSPFEKASHEIDQIIADNKM